MKMSASPLRKSQNCSSQKRLRKKNVNIHAYWRAGHSLHEMDYPVSLVRRDFISAERNCSGWEALGNSLDLPFSVKKLVKLRQYFHRSLWPNWAVGGNNFEEVPLRKGWGGGGLRWADASCWRLHNLLVRPSLCHHIIGAITISEKSHFLTSGRLPHWSKWVQPSILIFSYLDFSKKNSAAWYFY